MDFIARGTWLGGVLARYPGAPEVSKSDAHLMFRWYVSQIPQWLAEFDRVCARRGLHLPTGGFEGGVAVIDWIEEQCRTGQVVVELCDAARLARVRELVSGGERRFHCCPVGESSQCLMHLADVYLFQQIVAVREAEWVLLNERNGGDNGAPAVARTGRKRPLEEAALLQWQPELAAGPVRTIKPDECKERWRLLWETFPPRQP